MEDPGPKFGSHVENDDTMYTPRAYEKVCDSQNEAFWVQQDRLPKLIPKGLEIVWKGGWLGCLWYWMWGVGRGGGFPCIGQGLCSMNFPFMPKEGELGFLISLIRCGAGGKEEVDLKSCQQSNITMESDPLLQVLIKEMESYWLRKYNWLEFYIITLHYNGIEIYEVTQSQIKHK